MSQPTATTTCPTCRGKTSRAAAGKLYPFCSRRCWAVDLGNWLGESYRVAPHGDDAMPPPPRDDGGGDEHDA